MKRTDKNRRTKRGASSLFLAVIMSALILVECTFVAFVWNLDYALSVNEALKTQVDTILCDYNRQLFDVYGIYAFTLDEVDDECFCKALEMNGLTSQSTLVVTATDEFTTEDLKTAINSYYWYRGSGISLKGLVEGYISNLIYKGDHYSYVIHTDLEQDFIVDDEYLWNMDDHVGLIMPVEKMNFRVKK